MSQCFDWEAVRAFVAAARHGTLTGAATSLDVSTATLGRRIDALEAALGFRVVLRSPSGIALLPEGQRILALIEPGAERFEQLNRLARSIREDAERPPLRISSTEPVVADVLAPALGQLLARHPQVRVTLETSLELSNLNRGESDIAVRMVRPTSDSLITRRLPKITIGLFASAAYVGDRPLPLDPCGETLVWFDDAYGKIPENEWLTARGLQERVVMRAGSTRALAVAATNGVGIAPLPDFIARQNGLVRACDGRLADRSPWLVFHRDARTDAQSKAVRDWIGEAFRSAVERSA